MNILIVADTHGKLQEKHLKPAFGKKIDAVFCLGDVFPEDLKLIQSCEMLKETPKFGVIGEEDEHSVLKKYQIQDLHLKTTVLNGYRIGGFGGSLRFKDDLSGLMYTNPQSEEVLDGFDKCDILLTHDMPCFKPFPFFKHIALHSKCGMTGIAKYIRKNHPKFVFYGHIHEPNRTHFDGTDIRCCYGVETIEIPDKSR